MVYRGQNTGGVLGGERYVTTRSIASASVAFVLHVFSLHLVVPFSKAGIIIIACEKNNNIHTDTMLKLRSGSKE